jgi:PAS domain S-box-containing protein
MNEGGRIIPHYHSHLFPAKYLILIADISHKKAPPGLILTISVLYVDDEDIFLELGKRFLEQTTEFAVTTAPSAPVALDMLKNLPEGRIEAVVSDYQMPGTNGLELLKLVRDLHSTIPFILFTGKGREEIAIKAFENGADFYLQKGGEPEAQYAELGHKIKKAVEHRRDEKLVTTLSRLYSVLSATNRAIVHIHDKTELLNEICRIVVETGGFAMAWAGRINPEKHSIEPFAASDHADDYPETIPLPADGHPPPDKSPTAMAVHEKKFVVCNDIRPGSQIAPWREKAIRRGFHAIAAFPFATDTENAGVITYCSSEPGFFTDRIIRLLHEQSMDITFALMVLDHEEQRKAAEREYRRSELHYRRIFERAEDAILILDGETGEIINANPFVHNLLGYTPKYCIGKHLWELGFFKDKTVAEQAFAGLKMNGYIRFENMPLEAKDGRIVPVEYTCTAFDVYGKKMFQCNIRDITERKRTEDALVLASRKLKLLSSITRHDIRNQLLALDGYLDLSKDALRDPARISEYITKVGEITGTIAHQITFTSDYEDMGVKAPVWQQVNMVIRKSVASLPMRNIRVDTEDTDPEIFADPLLEKVFYNLLDNALRYGGDRITAIRVKTRENNGKLVIAVEDNGTGISAEDKKYLFTKGYGRHTGLGLYLSREILSITGITITENGEPGAGARFDITVPKGAWRFTGIVPPG